MSLTKISTGSAINEQDIFEKTIGCDFTIAIAGNPNVGKSTVFNGLTGMHQHTGNWPGKTVTNTCGSCKYKNTNFLLVDIPGTYSLMSNSEEEEIARNYICFGNPDATVVIVDATCLERNLNLVYQIFEITKNVIVCVNLLDEAKKKGISINLNALSNQLGVPVVGTTARNPKTLKNLIDTIYSVCNGTIKCNPSKIQYSPIIEKCITLLKFTLNNPTYISDWICLKLIDDDKKIVSSIEYNLKVNFTSLNDTLEKVKDILAENGITSSNFKSHVISSIVIKAEKVSFNVCSFANTNKTSKDLKIDKIITSKKFGIPIMILFLGIVFWLTIAGANYPSKLLFNLFEHIEIYLRNFFEVIHAPSWLSGILIDGAYKTLTWIIAVMLPPMAIFFPLFTFLEDLGYLPRIAFNLDKYFRKSGCSGKQSLTMCMGFGCNAAGVSGTKIIDSPREKLLAILTNAFVPCNGRFPFLICISTIFIGSYAIRNH